MVSSESPDDPRPRVWGGRRRLAGLTGIVLLGCALGVLVVVAGTRIIEEPAAPGTSAHHAGDRRLRTEQARAWSDRTTRVVTALREPYRADAAFRRRLAQQSNSAGLRSQAARQRASFSRALGQLRRVPIPPIRALRRSTTDLRQALALFVRGYAEIDAALAGNERRGIALSEDSEARRPLRAGVADTRGARRLLQAWSARLNTLGPLFYGR
jgi:hypothetical protein